MRIMVWMLIVLTACTVDAQRAATLHLRAPGTALYVTEAGAERKIADAAQKAWLVDGGRTVVYSGLDGAGGYENEGQSLHAFTLADGHDRKIMAEFFIIQKVKEIQTRAGATAWLVTMTDGGLGASHVAVVNPMRGEVLSVDGATFLEGKGNAIVVRSYRDADWQKLRTGIKVRPVKIDRYDADSLLKQPVLEKKPGG